jgi:hypothetical protein
MEVGVSAASAASEASRRKDGGECGGVEGGGEVEVGDGFVLAHRRRDA